ncbi:MAG: hypothetical protein JNM84_13095 [Planctomycetes bacterium]|nr:hypothetical protein [Planctomycetota bacterium]
MPSSLRSLVWIALLLAPVLPAAPARAQMPARVVLLVPIADEPSWRDDAYLAAIAAAAQLGDGVPLSLAVDAAAPWRPELLDFLRRLQPKRVLWLGEVAAEPPKTAKLAIEVLPASSALEAALACVRIAWKSAPRVVLCDAGDRSAALAAATLAARLREPLLPLARGVEASSFVEALAALGVQRALWVGSTAAPSIGALAMESLADAEAVMAWMAREKLPIAYLAAVNPLEAPSLRARHLSLAAPLLAAARGGAVAALPFEVLWKREFAAEQVLAEAPPGAAPSSAGWRRGKLALAGSEIAFVTSREPERQHLRVQFDRDGDGRFDGAGEGPLETGHEVELARRACAVDLHAQEKANGEKLWLTTPATSALRAELARYRRAAAREPEFLCLVGWPEALPMAIVDHGQGIDTDLVSDLPLAQHDADLFVEPAFARFVAEDLPSATLLACRGFVRDELQAARWRGRFATAEWAEDERGLFEDVGLRFAGHHAGGKPFGKRSPLGEVDLLVHSSHAMWTEIGQTYAWNTPTLLSPAFVISHGCSTASLDQDAERRSAPAHLLRNGAVAFAGNGRRGIAQSAFFFSALWNALQSGETLGAAHRRAANHTLVAMLDHGQSRGGSYYYQAYHQAVFGDPALALGYAKSSAPRAARTELQDQRAIVHGPARWVRWSAPPLDEWKCALPQIHLWRGAGVAVECHWLHREKRDEEHYYVVAEVRVPSSLGGIEPLAAPVEPLGWRGGCYIDEHADGTRSLLWRVRVLDADAHDGKVRGKVERAEFRLVES